MPKHVCTSLHWPTGPFKCMICGYQRDPSIHQWTILRYNPDDIGLPDAYTACRGTPHKDFSQSLHHRPRCAQAPVRPRMDRGHSGLGSPASKEGKIA